MLKAQQLEVKKIAPTAKQAYNAIIFNPYTTLREFLLSAMHKTLIVMENEELVLGDSYPEVLSFEKYLRDYPKLNEGKTRIINLCDTDHYLSKGYYCSLLAEARQHLVLPSVKAINELRAFNHDEALLMRLKPELRELLSECEELNEMLYFGWTDNAPLKKLGKSLF